MDSVPLNLLLVDDRRANLLALEAVLEPLGERLLTASSGAEALRLAHDHDFAAILLEVQMPGMDGFEVAARLRTLERSRETPLLFLTAQEVFDEQVVRGYKLGAVDFILKPFEPATLRAKVSVYTELSRRARGLESKLRETVDLEDRPTILLVDDVPGTLLAHAAALTDLNARLLTARNGYEALRLLLDQEPALILLDVHLPGLDGFETARLIRQRPRLAHVPILFVTATARAGADVTRGYGAGALDFLFLPMRPEVLQSKVQAVLNQFRRERLLQRQLREIERLEAASAAAQQQLKTFSETLEDKVQAQTAALRASEERFRQVVENILEVFWLTDVEKTRMFYVSAGYEKIWGRTCASLYRAPREWIDAVHPDDRERVLQACMAKQARGDYDEEYRVLHADGSVRWIRDRAFPIRDATGAVTRIAGVAEDITALKQADEARRRAEGRFRSMIENLYDLITTVDASGRIYFQSPSCRAALGYTPEELATRSVFELAHPDDAPALRAALDRALRRVQPPTLVELRFRHADGSWQTLECVGKRLPDEEPPLVVVNSRNITEQRKLEEQFRHAQKLEAIGQLAGGVAHDFNNMLMVMQGNASLLLADEGLSAEAKERARQVLQAAERAAGLTRQLLLFSRKQVMQPANLDLNEVVGNLTKMLQRILGEDIALRSEYGPNLPLVRADAGMLEQVLLNLAVNSRDAMPNGGRLTIATSEETVDESRARQNPEATAGRHICLSVTDTGCGIPPETLPHIFEPFFTTKEVGKGTGLGLATVYGIVKQHGGWIELATAPGQGTTFRVYLPAVEGPRAAAAAEAAPAKLPCGSETILIVEDETSLRALIAGLLRRCGYTVFEAASGPAALAIWNQHQASIHLLLTDVMLPEGMSGVELAKRLLAEKPQLKVICASGYSPDLPGPGAALLAGLSFLQKPLSYRKLAEAIRECLDQPQDRGKFDA